MVKVNMDSSGLTFCRLIAPTLFAFIAFFLSVSGVVRCNFIKFTSTSGFQTPVSIGFGPWRHESLAFLSDGTGNVYLVEACMSYNDFGDGSTYIDGKWEASKAFVIIPVVLGGISLICLFMSEMSCKIPKINGINSISYMLCCLFQGLSLMFLDSNACKENLLVRSFEGNDNISFQDTCSMSTGAKCAISATVFFFLAALASADAFRAEKEEEAKDDQGLDEPLVSEHENL